MGVFSRIWAGFGAIADAAQAVAGSLTGLSKSIDQANANLRLNLSLDPAPALPGPAEQTAQPEEKAKGKSRGAA